MFLGTLIYRLKGYDPDGDPLTFGVRNSYGSDILRIESVGSNEANVFLNKELDREVNERFYFFLKCKQNVLI